MAIINNLDDLDVSITVLSKGVTEISAVYNNHFIRRIYVGMKYNQAVAQFEEDLKKGNL